MLGTNGLLCLFIHQGVGQNHAIWFRDVGVASIFQTFTASDLETFATVEAGDPLSLWRFARDSSRIRETTNIFSWGVLDEFGLYRSHQHSYYLSDEARPNFLSLTSDFSGALRREAFAKRDWHPVPNWDGKTIAMVTTLHDTRKIPIYIGEPLWGDRAAAFVENLPFPLWVIAPADTRQTRQHRVYAELIDSLAYWLWQCQQFICGAFPSSATASFPITIQLTLGSENEWSGNAPEAHVAAASLLFRSEIDRACKRITLTFLPGCSAMFRTSDNEAERRMLHAALVGLRWLLGSEETITDAQIDNVISQRAPLGQKKMLLILDGNQDPALDPRDIPRFSPIPQSDTSAVLDLVGNFLTLDRNLKVGPVAKKARNSVLREIVAFCFSQLEAYVRAMSPEGLLEFMLERNEAAIRADARQRLVMPTRLACFAEVGDVVKEIKDQMSEIAKSGLAGRFLIEYVAAQ